MRFNSSNHTPSIWCSIAALFLITALVSAPVSAEPSSSPLRSLEAHHTGVHDQLRPAVVSILCEITDDRNPKQGSYYGTGVITSEDGYILSNTSVVPPGAENIRVVLHNRERKSAKLIGASMRFEVCLLKMEGDGYRDLDVGNSKTLELGDQIYSAGNAFGLSHQQGHISFSSGIVSGLYETESVYWQSQYKGVQMELDSSINPGTDGGPVVNKHGELVGVISLTADRARWMGMAVPTHLFRSYIQLLKSYHEGATVQADSKPYVGVTVSNSNSEDPTGIRVKDVTKGGPAWYAGLRAGDLIYMADGTDLSSRSDFDRVLESKSEGDQFLLFVERESQRWSLLLRVGANPL